jgi:hypothetical protein
VTDHLWLEVGIAIFGSLSQLIIAAYIYGKLTGVVAEHGRRHASHDTRFAELGLEQNRQWESIGRHGERISAVEARVQGLKG